jgi:hypothetical protein
MALPALASDRYSTHFSATNFFLPAGQTIQAVSGDRMSIYAAPPENPSGQSLVWAAVANVPGTVSVSAFIAGPAEVSLRSFVPATAPGHMTLRWLPGVADPNASLIVVPTTNAVSVRLESSTNLVDWTTAATVTLTNVPAATFYRATLAP